MCCDICFAILWNVCVCEGGHPFCSQPKCIWLIALEFSGPEKVKVAANALLVLRVGSLAWGSNL